jgi:chemotaxis methyl-accepting protein methylase
LRNRAELELIRLLLDSKPSGSRLDISIIACSKGAEVYSVLWGIRAARPDLTVSANAVDISEEILEFARRGVYSLSDSDVFNPGNPPEGSNGESVAWNTQRDQIKSIFERITDEELTALFDVTDDRAAIKSWLKAGINWRQGDAADPELVSALGSQDMVVANRFLCHMTPAFAERCLRNVARLVKPGGYLFVSGVDLDVRTKVAREMHWKPVSTLMREVHDGDISLKRGWPLEYWGLEPFRDNGHDWRIRYCSVFQIGDEIQAESTREGSHATS